MQRRKILPQEILKFRLAWRCHCTTRVLKTHLMTKGCAMAPKSWNPKACKRTLLTTLWRSTAHLPRAALPRPRRRPRRRRPHRAGNDVPEDAGRGEGSFDGPEKAKSKHFLRHMWPRGESGPFRIIYKRAASSCEACWEATCLAHPLVGKALCNKSLVTSARRRCCAVLLIYVAQGRLPV